MRKDRLIPIGVKLIGIVSLLIVFSLAGMTLLATSFFSTDVEQTVKLDTLDRAQRLSQKVETDLDSHMAVARLIAASLAGQLVYQGTGTDVTDQLLSQQPDFLGVTILQGPSGAPSVQKESWRTSLLASRGVTAPDDAALVGATGSLVESAFAGLPALGNISREFHYPVLALAFPYEMKGSNAVASVIVLSFTMDTMIGALTARELYHNYVVDASGTLVADPDQKLDVARPSLKTSPIVKASMTGVTQTLQLQYTDEAGQRNLATYKRFFNSQLTIISSVKTDTALASVYLVQRRNVLITVIFLCVTILLLFFFSRSLTVPLSTLVRGTNRVAEGDYSVKIPPTTRDEIGVLSRAFNHMSEGLAEREKIKSVFGKFVNKDVAERALKGDLQLGGEHRTAAIFFCDIRSFTSISESLTPHEVVEFLNEYMTRMVACVNETHGIVDKFIGDAIMAAWGIPSSHGNDTENAINGALLMRRALREFNRGRGTPRKPIIRTGAGINTGDVIAGQIGSAERMEYTCIGDAVNLASRIEALNKPFGTDILVSEYSWSLVKNVFNGEPMKKIAVKGKAQPQQIYAVLGRKDDASAPRTIDELHLLLGYETVALETVSVNGHEEKYQILE